MKKSIAAAVLVAVLALAGCSDTKETISGSVDTVTEALEEASVDDEFEVEVTGYILGKDPAKAVHGSDEDHSAIFLYQDTEAEEQGYIDAIFHETPDEINELINENTSPTGARRITIVGTSSGKDYGKMYTIVRDCEIKFD